MAGALHDVVRRREQRAAAKGEDHRVRVQRAQPAVGEPGDVEVQRRPVQLRGDEHTDGHADDAPDDGHDRKLTNDFVVVGFNGLHIISRRRCSGAIIGDVQTGGLDLDQVNDREHADMGKLRGSSRCRPFELRSWLRQRVGYGANRLG